MALVLEQATFRIAHNYRLDFGARRECSGHVRERTL
jgi:hypothetical protein